MRVVGITGTNGSGKGTVVEILKKYIDCTHISARQLIIDLAKEEGIDISDRNGTRQYNDQRSKEGKSLVLDFIEKYNIPENKNKIFVIESIRRALEIERLRNFFQEDFIMVAVDAPVEVRYKRINERMSILDNVDFKSFVEQERLESVSNEPHEMNIPKCIKMSDIKLLNDGDVEKFEMEIKNKLLNNKFFRV